MLPLYCVVRLKAALQCVTEGLANQDLARWVMSSLVTCVNYKQRGQRSAALHRDAAVSMSCPCQHSCQGVHRGCQSHNCTLTLCAETGTFWNVEGVSREVGSAALQHSWVASAFHMHSLGKRDLIISAIFASVEALREGLLEGGVLLGGPPRLGGKRAPTELLSNFFKLLLRT